MYNNPIEEQIIHNSFVEELERHNARIINASESKNVKSIFKKIELDQPIVNNECNICYNNTKCIQCIRCHFKYCEECFIKIASEFDKCSSCQIDIKAKYKQIEEFNIALNNDKKDKNYKNDKKDKPPISGNESVNNTPETKLKMNLFFLPNITILL